MNARAACAGERVGDGVPDILLRADEPLPSAPFITTLAMTRKS